MDTKLQKSWRPIVMLWFAFLIGLHWLGYTSDNLSENQVLAILEIMKLGFFGYIVGRSGEKIMKEYKSG